jgi:hypothetical protein
VPATQHERTVRRGLPWSLTILVFVLVGVIVGGAFGSIVSFTSSPTITQLSALSSGGRHTTALVTSIDRGNHNTCTFAYHAEGRKFTASKSCDASSDGVRIPIVYEPNDPAVETIGNPSRARTNDLLAFIIPGVLFGLLIAFASRRAYAAYARWQDQNR